MMPLLRHSASPWRKSISVGTDTMLYRSTISRLLFDTVSMRSIVTMSLRANATRSSVGSIALHAPHHVAYKSMSISLSLAQIILSKSDVFIVIYGLLDYKKSPLRDMPKGVQILYRNGVIGTAPLEVAQCLRCRPPQYPLLALSSFG